jgi:hypothetical protein
MWSPRRQQRPSWPISSKWCAVLGPLPGLLPGHPVCLPPQVKRIRDNIQTIESTIELYVVGRQPKRTEEEEEEEGVKIALANARGAAEGRGAGEGRKGGLRTPHTRTQRPLPPQCAEPRGCWFFPFFLGSWRWWLLNRVAQRHKDLLVEVSKDKADRRWHGIFFLGRCREPDDLVVGGRHQCGAARWDEQDQRAGWPNPERPQGWVGELGGEAVFLAAV